MISLGASLKRKSISKVEPTLPKPKNIRQLSSTGRTIYKQLRDPSQQLKQFRKRQLYTLGNLSTQKSQTNILHDDPFTTKQSRFDDDHHNTESIAQLLDSKNGSNLATTRLKQSDAFKGVRVESKIEEIRKAKDSLESESVARNSDQKDEERGDKQDDDESVAKQQNYDDYVLGDQVEPQEKDSKTAPSYQKYTHDINRDLHSRYLPRNQSQMRMEMLHWINQKRRLMQLHEDQQIIAIMQQYRNNKQQMLNQSRKKHQTGRILAVAQQNHPQNILEKSHSLPALKHKKEIALYDNNEEEIKNEPWKESKNLIAKGFNQQKKIQPRLQQSLSYGKLGFGRKKIRTVCQQDIFEQQMNEFERIKSKLRSKGVVMDADALKKGLVNIKKEPQFAQIREYPQKKLPSNFIYKKFPL